MRVQAILLDLDGVLYVGDQPIPGAAQAVQRLREAGLAMAGVTNTTTRSRRQIAAKLADMGVPLQEGDIHTPAALAVAHVGRRTARLFVRDSLREDMTGIAEHQTHPEVVVMGDIGGEGYPPETLREIFLHVMDGAELLALHRNRFWRKPDGLHLDLGAFVATIEYAAGVQAVTLGKPSRDFFLGICAAMGTPPQAALMVGDDVETDIGGAQTAGLKAALVQTGKYRADFVKRTGVKPDLTIPSIADLPDALHLL